MVHENPFDSGVFGSGQPAQSGRSRRAFVFLVRPVAGVFRRASHTALVLVTLLLSWTTFAQEVPSRTAAPVQNQPAPKIELKKLLNAPDGAATSWDALRGKVVVLEFWATWCGPCVASIPVMNKIETSHDGDPIVFIHVTDEEESVVAKFLEKTPIHGWVGLDDDRNTFKHYAPNGLPALAIVGKQGRFLGWSDPRVLAIEPEIFKDVLATGSSDQIGATQGTREDPLADVQRDEPTGGKTHNLCDIVIRRSDDSSASRGGGGDGRGLWNFDKPLIDHIGFFCDFPRAKIITTAALPEDHYDIIARVKTHAPAEVKDAVCRLIDATFDLSFTREKRLMDVYVLKPIPGREPTLTRSWGGAYGDAETHLSAPSKEILERMKKGENFFFTLAPLTWLANNVSGGVDKPVVAELGDLPDKAPEVYSFCFPYPRDDVEAFRKAFEEHVGLTLVPAQREVEVLIVGPARQ